jgi:type 1 fimbria pilin
MKAIPGKAYLSDEVRNNKSSRKTRHAVWLAIACALTSIPAYALDNMEVEGAHGVLYVSGLLTQGTCSLEMDSTRQDISLGVTGTGALSRPGDRSEASRFQLRLRDCLPLSADSLDIRTGGNTWSEKQPIVRVSFNALMDEASPQLIRAQGVSGLGLRLQDSRGRDVRLGDLGAPLWLMAGDNVLTYSITPERTFAILQPGRFQSLLNFNLSYN